MSNLQPLLERNKAFAETAAYQGLTPLPKHGLFVVTCIDVRVDPAHILGVGLGDALVLRNAGGRVTDEVVAEVVFISALAEKMAGDAAPPFEVAVVHHTRCGTGFLADHDFRRSYADKVGASEAELASMAVLDPAATVADDVARLLSAPPIPSTVSVSGHVYDVDTGLVTTVVETTAVGS